RFDMFNAKKSLHNVGDLVVFNKTKEFGSSEDRLFHIHSIRFGTCNTPQKQYWYAGYLLEIGEHESEGLPQVPIFSTTLTNVSEDHLKALEHLQVKFNPYK
ncbi:MAG: hypothetical protein ABH818_01785, partial [Patescibacteria group bacterium]